MEKNKQKIKRKSMTCKVCGKEFKEFNKLKNDFRNLTVAVQKHVSLLDDVMKTPSTLERGRESAKLSNYLDAANDSAMHFGLDMSFKLINKGKK